MRRSFLLIVIIIYALLCLLTNIQAEYSEEITFRSIPWGSTMEETKDYLFDFELDELEWCLPWISSWEAFRPYSSEIMYESAGFECDGYPLEKTFKVAGYKVSSISLFFAYPIIDNIVIKDDNQAELYLACYTFDVDDIED